MNAFVRWLDHRTGILGLMHAALYEHIPGGARWRYVWGSTLAFTFVVQMITGVFLWMAYSPSAQTASSVSRGERGRFKGNGQGKGVLTVGGEDALRFR